jgi:Tfp pilus assembly protein PilX
MRTSARRGSALVAVLLVISILATLGVALGDLATTDRLITKNHEQALRALYVARAGIAVALSGLGANPSWPGVPALPFGEGETIAVSVSAPDAAHRRVRCTGRVSGGERVLEVLVALGDPAVAGDESLVRGSFRER